MKEFESFHKTQLENYLNYRQDRGFEVKSSFDGLLKYDRYLCNLKSVEENLTPSFFFQMQADLPGENRTVSSIISSVRCFFQYLVRQGCYQKNPLRDIPPLRRNAIIPFVFSQKEVDKILTIIKDGIRTEEQYFIKDFSCYVIILLLARCGLRISEPLRMQLHHYRAIEKSIYIEKTKFKKDRLIPIPLAVTTEIENYMSVRNVLLPPDKQSQFLFVNDNGIPLRDEAVRKVFHLAVSDAGLSQPRQVLFNTNFNAPTPHSLRHSFAVNTLRNVKERGGSPQNALPILATYMGHVAYWHTVEYLKVVNANQHRNLVNFATSQAKKT